MRVAVVGHVDYAEFARVPHVPVAGEILHAETVWEEPGGGGAVAAVQLAKLAGNATFHTALGDDERGHRAVRELTALGVRVEVVHRPVPQRRAFVYLDDAGERTITVIGRRLGPHADDPLGWHELRETDAVYLTAGDAAAVRAARAARVLVATVRAGDALAESGVELDALVASAKDPGERYESGALEPPPRVVVRTEGAAGGEWQAADGRRGRWEAMPPPGPARDSYGCGDSFAAGLTYGLGAGRSLDDALLLAARCGAACLTGAGPYEGQLRGELTPPPPPTGPGPGARRASRWAT
jgi:ribokinase